MENVSFAHPTVSSLTNFFLQICQITETNMSHFGSGMFESSQERAPLPNPIIAHLTKVYNLLVLTTATAVVFCYVFALYVANTDAIILCTMVVGFATFLAIHIMSTTPKNRWKRVLLLLTFGASGGASAPYFLTKFDPTVVATAFVGSVVIFGSFSIASLAAKRRSQLYLGGMICSVCSVTFLLTNINFFLGSSLIDNVLIFIGLLVLSGYVVYHTQVIVENAACGDGDDVMDALKLFTDFFKIFSRLLHILSIKSKKKKRDDD